MQCTFTCTINVLCPVMFCICVGGMCVPAEVVMVIFVRSEGKL